MRSNRSRSRGAELAALAMLGAALLSGCHSGGSSPYNPAAESARDPAKAQELTRQAADAMMKHPDKAETLLRDALTADLYCGPAHNDLGVLYLKTGKLYEAAGEFEWAKKLMPGHPDPRVNLALTLEKAGRTKDAMDAYGSALEVYPGHLASLEGLARLQLASGKTDDKTKGYLDEIALRGETEEWRQWAKVQRARIER